VNLDEMTTFCDNKKCIGTHDVSIYLTDTNMNSQFYDFKITITNSAPIFNKKLKNVFMFFGDTLNIPLPKKIDLEL
jgi:hypothetical protein